MMDVAVARPVANVVAQHVEECAVLSTVRMGMVEAPHVRLHHLRRLDDRLAAHLDGLAVAGEFGAHLCAIALARPGTGEIFAATALAIAGRDESCLDKMLALAEALPECRSGMQSAFSWAGAPSLRDITRELLGSGSAFRRMIGIATCHAHRVDPGAVLLDVLGDPDPALRAEGLCTAGECGRRDLFDACVRALQDQNADCRFQAARSAVFLGERHEAIRVLHRVAHAEGEHRTQAIGLLLKLASSEQAVSLLRAFFEQEADARMLIRGLGMAGDPRFVPMLIDRMEDPAHSRLAGEAFSMITGVDLEMLDLDRKPPEGQEVGPTDDPADDDVAMDDDEGLPWPDVPKISAWWSAHASGFEAGGRYFMGATPSRDHCLRVRKEAGQRQRRAASEYLCLLHPGTVLFPTCAPAWRQQRWLQAAEADAE
jgi:uncharacterized protein (TIGR02270 family)